MHCRLIADDSFSANLRLKPSSYLIWIDPTKRKLINIQISIKKEDLYNLAKN